MLERNKTRSWASRARVTDDAAGDLIADMRPFRPRAVGRRPVHYAGITMLGHGDHRDHEDDDDDPVTVVTVTGHCSAYTEEDLCRACDGRGCPSCEPQKHNLNWKGSTR